MAVNGVEIKVGQVWRTRSGKEVTIVHNDEHEDYPWDLSNGSSVTRDGHEYGDGESGGNDLRELISEAPSSGNAELAQMVEKTPDAQINTNPGTAINPKDAIGATKLPLHLWPSEATALGCLGMLEGALKYGRNNFIAGEGVIASIYIAAAKRHLEAWFEGEENAPDTGTPHLANALATIAIIVKCQAHGTLIDDRNYSPAARGALYRKFIDSITPHVARLTALFADKSPRHFTIADVTKSEEGGAQ